MKNSANQRWLAQLTCLINRRDVSAPIMGAGGFIMAELTEQPYSQIMTLAIRPALLYFLGVFADHFEQNEVK